MAFEKTPGGTRGTNMPSFVAPVMKFMNNQMIRRFRRSAASGGKNTGMDRLVLTTVGAKSGQRRQTLLGTFPDGDSAWLIVASAGGQMKNPAWYHNLKAHPDATLERAGRSGRYRAVEVDDEIERQRLFELVDQLYPGYADYRVRAGAVGRRIPIMRLSLLDQ